MHFEEKAKSHYIVKFQMAKKAEQKSKYELTLLFSKWNVDVLKIVKNKNEDPSTEYTIYEMEKNDIMYCFVTLICFNVTPKIIVTNP